MSQPQIDRAFTNSKMLRSRNFSNRDNSFATARNLGTFFTAPILVRARGSVGRSDRKDVIKTSLAAGFSGSLSGGRVVIRGGTLTYSVYGSINGGRPQLQFTRRLPPGTHPFSTPLPSGALPSLITQFIVFDRPTGNVRYDYQENILN